MTDQGRKVSTFQEECDCLISGNVWLFNFRSSVTVQFPEMCDCSILSEGLKNRGNIFNFLVITVEKILIVIQTTQYERRADV